VTLIFLSALAVGFSGAMMPGSLLTYTIRQSLSVGPKAGFIVTIGHAILEFFLIILIFLGFDRVLQAEPAQVAISLVGGAFLSYMGLDMLNGAIRNTVKVQVDSGNAQTRSMLWSGLAISAANPYFLLWWAIIGLGFIMQSYTAFGMVGVALYFVGHITADFIWYGFVSTVVGTTKRFISEKPYRVIIAALGCLLIYLGGSFLVGAVT
jgi:threonine/homoserine/homoserine lactone efflux protein